MMVTKFGMSDKVIYACLYLTFMAMFTLVQNVYALQHPLAIAQCPLQTLHPTLRIATKIHLGVQTQTIESAAEKKVLQYKYSIIILTNVVAWRDDLRRRNQTEPRDAGRHRTGSESVTPGECEDIHLFPCFFFFFWIHFLFWVFSVNSRILTIVPRTS